MEILLTWTFPIPLKNVKAGPLVMYTCVILVEGELRFTGAK